MSFDFGLIRFDRASNASRGSTVGVNRGGDVAVPVQVAGEEEHGAVGAGYRHRFENTFNSGITVDPGKIIFYRLGAGFAINPRIPAN